MERCRGAESVIKKNIFSSIASLGCIGYLPASGTVASLCMIPYGYLIGISGVSLIVQAALIVIFFCVSFFIIERALPSFVHKDPSQIVLDECVGMVIALYALPMSLLTCCLAFLLFRLLDISKFFGLSKIERLPGAWGILLDDIAAACLTNVMLRLIIPLGCFA
jgi:phosphatidylglycerophosphatase A